MSADTTLPDKPSADLQKNRTLFDELLGVGVNWDIIRKDFTFGKRSMCSYCVNGFFMTLPIVMVMENIASVVRSYFEEHDKGNVDDLISYINTRAAFVQITATDNMDDLVRFALSGPIVLFIDGMTQAIVADTRIYPMRSIAEPEVERVVRGPRDGFTETMLVNTSLVRRRIRDPKLRIQLFQVGTRSRTDVSLLYIEDITDPSLLDRIREDIKAIQTDAIPMAEGALSDYLTDRKWQWDIYPSVRLTERPDVVATCLMEGQAAIIVDTTPEAMIMPNVFLQHIHHPEDYHLTPFAGTYMRWVQLVATFACIFLTPLWLVLLGVGHNLPHRLAFVLPAPESQIPVTIQLLILEFGIDVFRRAVINTPVPLASAIGIVAGIVFGQLAVKAQLLDTDVLVYGSLTAVFQFSTSSMELAAANRISRIFLIILTGLFSLFHLAWVGFVIGLMVIFIGLACKKSFGIPYLWPLVPFDWKALKDVLLRMPLKHKNARPAMFDARDRQRK